jgi:extracellular factor (EF) 3-hydroxypalmitic acid methyl ester biosynthesis protein
MRPIDAPQLFPREVVAVRSPWLNTSHVVPQPSAPPSHEYEPLTGGTGKEIYFRQARYAMAELLGEHKDIDHVVEFDSLSGVIINYGINGVAFSLSTETPPQGEVLPNFTIRIGKDVLYHGRASVRYCRTLANHTITVGVVLLDGILDTDAMIRAKSRALATKTASSLTLALRADVSRHYKEAMADLVLLLSSYRTLLDRQETSIASLSTMDARQQAEEEVLAIAVAEFSPHYDRYRKLCNQLTVRLDKESSKAHRQYTEAVLHPYILSAPLAYHCYCKPLGYPGDYMLMAYLYDPQPHGSSLYDKLVHQVVIREEPMAIGVQQRKNFLLDRIRSLVTASAKNSTAPCRILSLACGPAQEIVEFAAHPTGDIPIEFTLIDQDQRSLTHANSTLSKLLIPGSTNVTTRYLYLGFRQMISEHDAFDSLPQQDLIYAAGLFDYIKASTARQLAVRLFKKLRPAGTLIIGNFRSPNDATWALDYWMDWRLIYRDADDMHAIADLIDETHRVELSRDPSGYTHMLMITRS